MGNAFQKASSNLSATQRYPVNKTKVTSPSLHRVIQSSRVSATINHSLCWSRDRQKFQLEFRSRYFGIESHRVEEFSRRISSVAVRLSHLSVFIKDSGHQWERKRALIYGAVFASPATLKGDFPFRGIKLDETKRR